MSTFTQFLGGAKPKQVTTYTTGTGTHATTGANAWCYVTLVGGGGGGGAGGGNGNPGSPGTWGGRAAGDGGRKGGIYQAFVQLSPNVSYAVGAAGPAAGAGGNTTLGPLTAVGGQAGQSYAGAFQTNPFMLFNFNASGLNGESGTFGSGGRAPAAATGYGSGGGGGGAGGGAGSAGSGGLIIIEDFGP